jgi:hypothetical protein
MTRSTARAAKLPAGAYRSRVFEEVRLAVFDLPHGYSDFGRKPSVIACSCEIIGGESCGSFGSSPIATYSLMVSMYSGKASGVSGGGSLMKPDPVAASRVPAR